MNVIRFSENYPKLWNQKKATLLAVKRLNSADLHKDLIEYDTKDMNGNYYKLPNGELIHLIFLGDKGIPFCTIRRFTEDKLKYYINLINKPFEVSVQKEGEFA